MSHTGTSLETLVVGLDGACDRVLQPQFDAGALPNLADLFDSGVSGPLESQVPPWTASAWPSLYTGTNPGKHGVFGFLDFDGYDWDVVNASTVRERTLWEYLDWHGQTSVVVNAPVSYPPPAIDGAVVPGYLAPENPRCHPEGLLAEIREAIGAYRVYASLESDRNATTDDRVREYGELARMRGEAFAYLVDRFDPTFGFLQFQHTDTILHETPEDPAAVESVYGAVDEQVGEVIEACDPDTIVVVSDHGLGPYEQRVRINEVLRDGDFLTSTSGGDGMPSWASIRDEGLVDGVEGRHGHRGVLERAVGAAAATGLTAQRVAAFLDQIGLRDPLERHIPKSLIRMGSEQVDFPNSTAYVRSRVECGVRINLAGREPNGVVPPDEYETVRERLISILSGIESPAGEPVFEDVARRERYFHGPAVEDAVDVVTIPNDYDYYVTTWLMGEYFADPDPPGWDHKREGVFAAVGSGIDADCEAPAAHLFDVAPTVLATLGLPSSDRMDGCTLPVVDDAGDRTYPPIEDGPDRTVSDPQLEKRLEDLGYLE